MQQMAAPTSIAAAFLQLCLPLQIDYSGLTGGSSPRVDVVEIVKGSSALEGTLTLAYRGGFTQDLAFDAAEDEIKAALEAVDTVSTVSVSKINVGAGFEW